MHAWAGTVSEFLSLSQINLISTLKKYEGTDQNIDSKINAWEQTIYCLKEYFENKNAFSQSLLFFEYLIPLSGGRRPDVIFLHGNHLCILEFKGYGNLTDRDVIQKEYYQSHFKFSSSFVREFNMQVSFKIVSPGSNLDDILSNLIITGDIKYSIQDFLNNKTISSINLLQDFDKILIEGQSEFSQSSGTNLDQVYVEIENIIDIARSDKKHILIFVNGLPGSGKTMLGLKIASLRNNEAIYLSGNDSLIKVFRHKILNLTGNLKSKITVDFVQYFKNFKENIVYKHPIHQNIFIFDEGQRAWSSKKVEHYYKNKPTMQKIGIIENWQGKSEAHIFLDGLLLKEWGVGIVLVGNNQEIYDGEEKGLSLWNEPFQENSKYQSMQVYLSSKTENTHVLDKINNLNFKDNLFLNKNFRSIGNDLLYEWVDSILSGKLEDSKKIKSKIKLRSSFHLETCLSLEDAIETAKNFYPDADNKTLGLLKPSGVSPPKRNGTSYYLSDDHAVTYFNGPSKRNEYCKNFRYMANEFECQGLELDFVIFYWGHELRYLNGRWSISGNQDITAEKLQLKLNAYRVLMTRAREGMIIVYPKMK